MSSCPPPGTASPGVGGGRLVADLPRRLEPAVGDEAAGVHHPLGDAFAVEMADLLEEVVVSPASPGRGGRPCAGTGCFDDSGGPCRSVRAPASLAWSRSVIASTFVASHRVRVGGPELDHQHAPTAGVSCRCRLRAARSRRRPPRPARSARSASLGNAASARARTKAPWPSARRRAGRRSRPPARPRPPPSFLLLSPPPPPRGRRGRRGLRLRRRSLSSRRPRTAARSVTA